ncbi:spermidine/putrescine transport system permease protein [Halopenitus malekzadehii]|uniref:Spermidine/putrescine transport system permease protein n=1 Tax=Halopenitus malekzadehii TaxID=1267564 RepID=A0A1H6J9J0_9EURY|nr:ABC transporter permease [Halopenitus malekzadehii]SEH57382.1 spermidine/putrescine transport system permease protein [Halopenitus malekzadehii]
MAGRSDAGSAIGDRIDAITAYFRSRPRLRTLVVAGPPYAVLVLFFAIPLLVMLVVSFQTSEIGGPWTLSNYTNFLTSETYLTVVWQTLVISLQVTAIIAVVGYALAYSIVRFSRRTTLLLLLVILPFWTSYIIRMYAWINILQSDGVLDSTLNLFGLPAVGLLYSQPAVLIGFTYVWLPLAILPFYASLTNLDPDLIEASKDLGAGPIRTFTSVTLPMTKNGVITGLILTFIPTFGSFITPRLLGGTNNIMIGMVIENQFKSAFNWPFGAAIGMVISVVVVALLILATRFGGGLFGQRSQGGAEA